MLTLLYLKMSQTAEVSRMVTPANGKYQYHGGLGSRISMFIPKDVCRVFNLAAVYGVREQNPTYCYKCER